MATNNNSWVVGSDGADDAAADGDRGGHGAPAAGGIMRAMCPERL